MGDEISKEVGNKNSHGKDLEKKQDGALKGEGSQLMWGEGTRNSSRGRKQLRIKYNSINTQRCHDEI